MKKTSFKISWLDDEEVFLVKQLYGNEVVEERRFEWHCEVYEYIANEQEMLQIAGETWTLTY